MKKQVVEAIENAKANLDQAIAGLEKIPEIDTETLGYTAHKLKNYPTVAGATSELLEVYLAGHPDEQLHIWIRGRQHGRSGSNVSKRCSVVEFADGRRALNRIRACDSKGVGGKDRRNHRVR
jgi:hypothetical protein